MVTSVVGGDCPIVGLGSFGNLAFWGQKRSRWMGPHIPSFTRRLANHNKVHWKDKELSRVVRRLAHLLHHGRPMALAAARDAGGQAMARLAGVAPPARRLMSIYAVVKDPRRGKRQGRDEPRAQESGVRVYGSPCGVSPQAGYSGEARAPKSIIQEGKKRGRGLMIVFMEIQPVTRFSREI